MNIQVWIEKFKLCWEAILLGFEKYCSQSLATDESSIAPY